MNKKSLFSTILVFLSLSSFFLQAFTDRKLIVGAIDLPSHFEKMTNVRVWHGGKIIACDIDSKSKKISFELSIEKSQTFFYLVVVDDIIPSIEDNTVHYFSATKGADYKIYSLIYSQETNNETVPHWIIKQLHIPLSRIPDDAIIVYFPGSYVDHLEGGSSIELPKLVLKKDLNQETVHTAFTKQLLKAINYDSLHASITRDIKPGTTSTTLVAFNW
jgi:hypothetical protein